MSGLDDIRRYWDLDAATYDDAPGHRPTSAAVQAAWTAALEGVLPPPPTRVLDCGAGTGFFSLVAARLGHVVTALDVSAQMLERLLASAAAEGLEIDVVHGPATEPPEGFDVVMERHLLWTLPDPVAALRAWRQAAPAGRLVAVESVWGDDADVMERARARARDTLRRLRAGAPDHHAPYSSSLRASLPLGSGTPPRRVVELVVEAGWLHPRLQRLRDVEWATTAALSFPERLLATSPRFVVSAT